MLTCLYAGIDVEQKLGKISNQKTGKIAVANLDERVVKQESENDRIYYSKDLLGFNHSEMEVIFLESTRNGIIEGRYRSRSNKERYCYVVCGVKCLKYIST
jgi:6-phosphogluconolactonase/glucosamine-6-phosphate isomerase/deaminase